MYTASTRYMSLTPERDPYLVRARRCAKLTIPTLMPEMGATGSTAYYTPYQSLGARGVNNLASKLLLALLPPQSSFFRLAIDDFALAQLAGQDDQRAQIEEALGKIERTALQALEGSDLRTVCFEAFKQLVNSGNCLLVLDEDYNHRAFRMDKYVVRRSPSGRVLELIIQEEVAPESLEPDVLSMLPPDVQAAAKAGLPSKSTMKLYTVVRWENQQYHRWQEINDQAIEGTQATYPEDRCPYLALRFIRVDGEHYGRSYVEEYFGDLRSMEGLEKAILLGAASSAKVLFLVNPNGTTRLKDVSTAESGDVKAGHAQDVTVVQTLKSQDFNVARETSKDIQNRLAFAFLLNSAIQRNGERVTAEEIRFMARELEDALGGIYSVLAQEFQKPLVTILLAHLRQKKKIPALPKGSVTPVIVTGMEALGRGQDLARLDEFINGIPVALQQSASLYLNVQDYLSRRATALGLDQAGLVKTTQEVQQDQAVANQQQATQTLLEKGTAPVAGALAKGGQQGPPPAQ